MGLKDDMHILGRHIERGTGKQWLEGTAEPLPPEPAPIDRSATMSVNNPGWMAARGD